MTVFDKIQSQQGKVQNAVWMVGEQLKDICRSDPHCAEIVMQDLENPDMSLAKCEKKSRLMLISTKPVISPAFRRKWQMRSSVSFTACPLPELPLLQSRR